MPESVRAKADPLDGARERLPAATAALTDQPIPPERDMYEQFDLC